MSGSVVFRFRDLVTEPGGTIQEHLRIIRERGRVWWGWWMRQHERPPRKLFEEMYAAIADGHAVPAYLFDSGRSLLYACSVGDLRIAQPEETIGPPELDLVPSYYHRGRYPAWLRLDHIEAVGSDDVPRNWRYESFPTHPEKPEHAALVGEPVASFDELRFTDATLWIVKEA